jgi:hypothetical protein
MSNLSEDRGRVETPGLSAKAPPVARPSRLLQSIYRDIGLAAVAAGLEMPVDSLDAEVGNAIRRGARYIHLMPRSKS